MVSQASKRRGQFSKSLAQPRGLISRLTVGVGVMLAAITSTRGAGAADKTVTIETGTGEYADCLRSSFYEPFEKATGIKILTAPENHNNSKFKLEVQTRHYVADVHFVSDSSVGADFLEPIDYSIVKKDGLIIAQPYAVAIDTLAYTLGYNTQKTAGKAPTGWADFFDLQKFPGKRAVGNSTVTILMMALLADGVAPQDIVPLDYDRAFRKLNSIKSSLVFWDTGSQVQDLLASGETPLAMIFANRVASSRASGKPVEQVWNGALIGSDLLGVSKGNPNKAVAMEYLGFVLSKEINGRQTSCIALGPANSNSEVNPKWRDAYPTSHLSEPHVLLDSPEVSSWVAAHRNEIKDRFQLWKSQ